jgi:hypothetical protein
VSTLRGLAALVVLAAAVAFSTSSTPTPQSSQTRRLRILFIGNSLTAANGLPSMVESFGRSKKGWTVSATAVTASNYSLEDHWTQGNARTTIAKGGWSIVVLQQGPSALPESRVLLRGFTKRFADEATRAGARTALYMVWPSKARFGDFPGVSESYRLAASDVHGTLLPAGDAWRLAWREEPSLALYAEDNFHPSPLGSYLAALTIWRGLSGETVSTVPAPRNVAKDAWRILQQAADGAVTGGQLREFAVLR